MVKTDNHNPKAKLDLRRFFLNKYHADIPPSVFDCCQGSAVMWTQLQKEFAVASYWGVDLKPKKGRLKIDSVRIVAQGLQEDIIDIDTYGEPWKHWLALLPKLIKPVTVFLTIATVRMGGGGNISNESKKLLGIDKLPSAPQSFCGKISALVPDLMLSKSLEFATIIEAVEAVSTGNARYIGVRLEPIRKDSLPAASTASKPKHRKAAKELSNV